jgi:hypothetical protein
VSRIVEPQVKPTPNKSAAAVIDAIEDEYGGRVTVAPSDGRVYVRGWALDAGGRALAEVEIDVGGARASARCAYGRPDVAAIFGSPDLVGFRIELALEGAPAGHHVVAMTGRRQDGSSVRIPVAVSLDVVPPLRSLPPRLTPGAVVGAVDEIGAEGAEPGSGEPVQVPADGVLVVRGWAAAPDGTPATLAYAEFDGQRLVRGMSGYPRPDVALQFNAERPGYGFRIRIAASDIGPGEHTLRVRAVVGRTSGVVGQPARIAVAPPRRPNVFHTKPRMRGRIDVVGRLDGGKSVVEERSHLRLGAAEQAVITGWAGDPVGMVLPNRVMLVVDGVAHGPVQRGIERDDVVAATACERLRASGFSAVVRADGLGAGFHRAELIALYGAEPVVFDAFSFEVIA